MQTPLAGFGFVPDVYSKASLTDCNQETWCNRLDQLNDYIKHLPSSPGFKVPSFGLTSGERATDLFTPVAILAVPSLRSTFLPAAQGLLL